MSEPTREETYIETLSGRLELSPPPPPTQMPINPTERRWRMHRGLHDASGRAMDVLHTTKESATRVKESASRVVGEARKRAADGYSRLSHRTGELSRQTRELGRQTRDAARYAKQQYPVRVLGVIAASAFVVGIGLRAWRSRHS